MSGWETIGKPADGWETIGPARINPNLQRQGVNIETAREGIRAGAEFMSRRDPGIDYKTGIQNARFRAGFSRMTNDAEKAQFLDRMVGSGAWGKDSFGAYFIKPEGLHRLGAKSDIPVSLDEQSATRYDIADLAGDAPAIVGGVAGGMAASGLGAIPGMALAGLGAAGGKALDEIVKNLSGDQVKSSGEVASEIGMEGFSSALGEGGARVLAPVGRFLMGPAASRMTPEKKALADSAIEQGFKIRPGSVTDAPILARWEGMVRSIFGDLYKDQNLKAAEKGIAQLKAKAGQAVSKDDAGMAIAQSIKAARVRFSEKMGARYAEIDQMVGNTPIIPTVPVKVQAEQLLAALPKTADGKVIGGKDAFLRDILNMGDQISVTQAQRLRTMLREASESPDLVPDVAMHEARVLKKALDESFETAKTPQAGVANEAIEKLRMTDASYREGIRRFDNGVVASITKTAGKPGGVDPDMVVDYLIKPERVARLRYVKNVASEEAWGKVKSAHAAELLESIVKKTDDPLATIFDGKAFRDQLDKYGKQVLEEVHGKEWADQAYKFANALMLSNKKMALSGGIVAANIALHPVANLPKLVWLRAVAKVMEQPGTFKYLTEGFNVGPNTKEGAMALSRFANQVMANARDETGSARFTVTEQQ